MLRLIIILIFLILSVGLGILAVQHPGYLLIVYKPWMVQIPLWLATLGLLIFLVLFYAFIASINNLYLINYRIRSWFRTRSENQLYSKTQRGLAALIEWRWQQAEKLLLEGSNQSLEPLINYLGAAKAAHEQGAYERRDQYIQDAYRVAPKSRLAIGLTHAELKMDQKQWESALAILTDLRELAGRHPRVLKLVERVYVEQGDLTHIQSLLPYLHKSKLITTEEMEIFEKNIYCEFFKASSNKTLEELHNLWDKAPRTVRKDPAVAYEYALQLQRCQDFLTLENLIRKTLQNHWQAGLVKIYSQLPFNNLNRQLVIAGAWLKTHGPQPELLLFLGKLCVRVQLWGKAKDYFEKCLAQGPNPEASLAYGDLLQQLDEHEQAVQVFREGCKREQT